MDSNVLWPHLQIHGVTARLNLVTVLHISHVFSTNWPPIQTTVGSISSCIGIWAQLTQFETSALNSHSSHGLVYLVFIWFSSISFFDGADAVVNLSDCLFVCFILKPPFVMGFLGVNGGQLTVCSLVFQIPRSESFPVNRSDVGDLMSLLRVAHSDARCVVRVPMQSVRCGAIALERPQRRKQRDFTALCVVWYNWTCIGYTS